MRPQTLFASSLLSAFYNGPVLAAPAPIPAAQLVDASPHQSNGQPSNSFGCMWRIYDGNRIAGSGCIAEGLCTNANSFTDRDGRRYQVKGMCASDSCGLNQPELPRGYDLRYWYEKGDGC